ncbi:formimidoylglutamase [Ulvibacter antarcticus]|uniref:Formiminoglutamase n=1 Tax=Ulvibacter antarcticus TaxID=442714 RepID=A0A3L9YE67_9FLAO|nr:formimidoylglutamase [Ulvibacter antarcticus]RMA58674.1 formiminoglutamase [Ulvibacter antarcticus]
MSTLKTYTKKDLESFTNPRTGEQKFGEVVMVFSNWDELKKSAVKYVLVGIPETIGVRANLGKSGAETAWTAGLRALCNIQNNRYTNAKNVMILGEIDCKTENEKAGNISNNDPNVLDKLGELVTQIDNKVSEVVQKIVEAGKIPILIGGGHNNSFGNIKGSSNALGKPINCINFDAHTDFRALEHRHSGNGFSYAFEDGFLQRYFIFGLHLNYTSQAVFESIHKHESRVKFNLFESISVSEEISFTDAMKQANDFCCGSDFGLELDMDAIEAMGSSAMTPSGFSITEARRFMRYFAKKDHCRYIHICEGNPEAGIFPNQVAKTISYLISDVISI